MESFLRADEVEGDFGAIVKDFGHLIKFITSYNNKITI